jgi:hypothetical protein
MRDIEKRTERPDLWREVRRDSSPDEKLNRAVGLA